MSRHEKHICIYIYITCLIYRILLMSPPPLKRDSYWIILWKNKFWLLWCSDCRIIELSIRVVFPFDFTCGLSDEGWAMLGVWRTFVVLRVEGPIIRYWQWPSRKSCIFQPILYKKLSMAGGVRGGDHAQKCRNPEDACSRSNIWCRTQSKSFI